MSQQYAYPIGPPTREDLDNVMAYGTCWICGWPRRRYVHTQAVDGHTTVTAGLTCPNACDTDASDDALQARLDNVR